MFFRYITLSTGEAPHVQQGLSGMGKPFGCGAQKQKKVTPYFSSAAIFHNLGSRDSELRMASKLKVGRSKSRDFPVVQTSSGTHLTFQGSFPSVKWPGRELDYLPSSSSEVKDEWNSVYPHIPSRRQ